jgi:hypothetical protein
MSEERASEGRVHLLFQLKAAHSSFSIARVQHRAVVLPRKRRDFHPFVHVLFCLETLGLELWVPEVVLPHHHHPRPCGHCQLRSVGRHCDRRDLTLLNACTAHATR